MSTLRHVVTPGRLAWLRRLARERVVLDGRGKGPVGFQCMRLGWTQWVYVAGDSTQPMTWSNLHAIGETLTDEGRRVLAKAEGAISSAGEHAHTP